MTNAVPAEPLYKKLKQDILDAIQSGVYREGQKIPTEKELIEQYQVSRMTVRNAVNELVAERYLVRKQGQGTFVCRHKWNKNLAEIKSFSTICKEMNCVPDAKVIKSVIEEATVQDAENLGVEPGSPIIAIERIRYADSVPVSLEVSHFIEDFSFLLQENLNHRSMYDILREKYGITFVHTSRFVEITFANFKLATYLGLKKGHPILLLSGAATDNLGRLACYTQQLIVGDKFRLTL